MNEFEKETTWPLYSHRLHVAFAYFHTLDLSFLSVLFYFNVQVMISCAWGIKWKQLAHRVMEERGYFECPLCLGKFMKPIVTLCGHIFCGHCLHKWALQSQGDGFLCPMCRNHNKLSCVIPIYGHGIEEPTASDAKCVKNLNNEFQTMEWICAPRSSNPTNISDNQTWMEAITCKEASMQAKLRIEYLINHPEDRWRILSDIFCAQQYEINDRQN